MSARAAGLVAGFALDAVLADPRRGHPVAGFGRLAGWLEERWYADTRLAGLAHWGVLVGAATAAGAALDRAGRGDPLAEAALTTVATWVVLGGRSLDLEAARVHAHLAAGDLVLAREQVTHLVGRDPAVLDPVGVARATVESVAENTCDAVVAPLLWGAAAGPAGLLGYRAANTLDAMVGHRSTRYARFGWAAARLDDVANLLPARLAALAVAVVAPRAVGQPAAAARALRAWRRDAHRHPSPNAGPVEAAFAGALGVTLGGENSYAGTLEDRGALGSGPAPGVADIPRAVRLARAAQVVALVTAAVAASARPRRRR